MLDPFSRNVSAIPDSRSGDSSAHEHELDQLDFPLRDEELDDDEPWSENDPLWVVAIGTLMLCGIFAVIVAVA